MSGRGVRGRLRDLARDRSYRFRSARSRLTLGVTVVLAVVLGAAGAVIEGSVEEVERRSLDDRLRRTAELALPLASAAVEDQSAADDDRLGRVLRATLSSLVVSYDGAPVLEAGRTGQQPGRDPLGFSTRPASAAGGPGPVRTWAQAFPDDDLARIEVASSLEPVEERLRGLRTTLLLVGAASLLLAGAGTWAAADRVLRPLRRLRSAAAGIEGDDDLERRVPVEGATEVRELAGSFNAMLERLGRSATDRTRALEATRRFAADVGHELRTPLSSVQAALSLVHRHPDADPELRRSVLADALAEQRRVVALLDGLQTLARGDSVQDAHEDVDLREVVGDAVEAVQRRHPGTRVVDRLPERPVIQRGWEPGLRVVVENLVGNAAVHGRAGGEVVVELREAAAGRGPVLVVADDGEGVPASERGRVFEPFARAGDGERPGSGLGLAVVAQQAAHHDARVGLDEGPAGGARFTVRFPAQEVPPGDGATADRRTADAPPRRPGARA